MRAGWVWWLIACSAGCSAAPAAAPPPPHAIASASTTTKSDSAAAADKGEQVTIPSDEGEQQKLIGQIEQACQPAQYDWNKSRDDDYASRCRANDSACIDAQPQLEKLATDGHIETRVRALKAAADMVAYSSCGTGSGRDRCVASAPTGSIPIDTSLCDSLLWVVSTLGEAAGAPEVKLREAAAYGFARDTTRPAVAVPALRRLLQGALRNSQDPEELSIAYHAIHSAFSYRDEASQMLPELRQVVESRLMWHGQDSLVSTALMSFGQMGPRGLEALDLLVAALEEKTDLRFAAVNTLMNLASQGHDISAALPSLRRHSQSRDANMNQAAKAAVQYYEQTHPPAPPGR